jgi:leucyl aminopeptidase (aminopeptidase T)
MISAQALERAAMACMDCLGVATRDRALIVSNPPHRRVAKALLDAARGRTNVVRHIEYATLARHGEEPPDAVAHALEEATVALAPTVYSISHTRARIEATARGVRIAGMSSLSEAAFASALPIDYRSLEHSTAVVARALTAATTCRLTSTAGTDLTLELRGRAALEDNGNLRNPGAFGNLPAGEVYIAPIETIGDGTIVVDGSLAGYGLLRQPLRLRLHSGRIVDAAGEAADWLLRTLDAGRLGNGRTIAELGIGVNPCAHVTGTILDEKARGTAHVAFGTNVSFGGVTDASVHVDAVLLKPTMHLDDVLFVQDGEIRFEVSPLSGES